MKIFIRTSFNSLSSMSDDKDLIARLKKILAVEKIKGKIETSKEKGTINILPVTVPTSTQYKSLVSSVKAADLNIKLVQKTNPISKQPYYEVVPSRSTTSLKAEKEDAVLKFRLAASKISPKSKDLHNQLNAKSKSKEKAFGFWRADPLKEMNSFPFPVAVEVPRYNKTSFMSALKKFMSECTVEVEKGNSPNRWNGSNNGSREYRHPNGWRMPEGALYYLSRGVPPTQEFYKAVTGKTNSKLPSAKNYSI